MYVSVKGGERAITAAHTLLAEERRGDPAVPELTLAQIEQQMSLGVDRVMSEGALYDPELAALAIKQARGDMVEAIFLLRAYRTTLPRLGDQPADRHRADGGAPAHLRHLQGHSRRPGAGPDLRLHPPPAGFRPGRGDGAGGRSQRFRRGRAGAGAADAVGRRDPRRGRPAGAGAARR